MGPVVVDASIVVAALSAADPLHRPAVRALRDVEHRRIAASVITYAEVLVGARRRGAVAVSYAESFFDEALDELGDVTVEVARRAAAMRAEHRALGLPDAIVLATAELTGADRVLTGDARWRSVSSLVQVIAT